MDMHRMDTFGLRTDEAQLRLLAGIFLGCVSKAARMRCKRTGRFTELIAAAERLARDRMEDLARFRELDGLADLRSAISSLRSRGPGLQ